MRSCAGSSLKPAWSEECPLLTGHLSFQSLLTEVTTLTPHDIQGASLTATSAAWVNTPWGEL